MILVITCCLDRDYQQTLILKLQTPKTDTINFRNFCKNLHNFVAPYFSNGLYSASQTDLQMILDLLWHEPNELCFALSIGEGREGVLRCPWNEEIKITKTTALVRLLVQVTVLSQCPVYSEILGCLKIRDPSICLKRSIFSGHYIKNTKAVTYRDMLKSLSILGFGLLKTFSKKLLKELSKK